MSTPPLGLTEAAEKLWSDTTEKYDLRTDELRVLESACRELDLIVQMDGELSKQDGFMSKGSMGQPVIHPLIPEIRQHRTTLASLLRSLKLPDDGGQVNQQRSAGQSSWAARRGA